METHKNPNLKINGRRYKNLNEVLGAIKTPDTAKPFIKEILRTATFSFDDSSIDAGKLIELRRDVIKEFGDTGSVQKGFLQKLVDMFLWFFYAANFKKDESLSDEVSNALGGTSVDVMKVPGDGNCALTSTLCLLRGGTDISFEEYKAIKREGELARSVLGDYERHGIPEINVSNTPVMTEDEDFTVVGGTSSDTPVDPAISSGVQEGQPAEQRETAVPERPRLGLSGVDSARARALGHAGENLKFS
ncbi:MAG: hypothetical protein LBB14_02540, partial [Puniceicoccales bacterium]|nr:hypothetical protein [Puniceicoccales bacterium]